MENGYDVAEKLSGMKLGFDDENNENDNKNSSSLFQVMKAVEAAEATIKQQVEENNRLRAELQHKILLLDRYQKVEESMSQLQTRSHVGSYQVLPNHHHHQQQQQHEHDSDDISATQNHPKTTTTTTLLSNSSAKINGSISAAQPSSANNAAAAAALSSPSTASFLPTRFQMEGEYDPRLNMSAQGLMPVADVNNPNTLWKRDLALKIQDHEEEIMQLRKHLADYSIKEAQVRNEKHVLEKRIAYMRLAFDQQQQELVDAASKALSYRQDIIEENIRLTYALQDAQQERSTFISSLLPLLAEYSLQPPVPDAQSIVSNVKVLFKHLQEKLFLTESKLKESQYQLTPWRSDVNHSNVAPPSPSPSIGAALATSSPTNGLELVPQPTYSHGKAPLSTPDGQTNTDWDILVRQQGDGVGGAAKLLEPDDVVRYSPLASRTSVAQDLPTQVPMSRGDTHVTQYSEETSNKQVTFRDPVRNSDIDDQDAEGNPNEREMPANWSSAHPPYMTTLDDLSSSYSPYLPPVLEEPSSSFSEAADDDLLPAIHDLQISGEAYPGRELQACGYSINGTTSCNFEWVRHLEDGSVNYIEGAKQPNYLVTADDVDTYLAIEVQPLDNRKRKGELVKVFANGNKKITCDPEMQNHIEKTLHSGHASYKVLLSAGYIDIWEQATLAIKRDAYSIKGSGSSSVVHTEKFSPATTATIPYGSPSEFIVTGSSGVDHLLKVDNSSDVSCCRDTIVLTLRLFILRAGERRKGKKRGLFFNK
ncbi:uncharacterized protein LOC21389020 isoform X2 [Morus notabilis]|uniref:uncharacterized protein LOC21389020 isoform X2 n=1 Tax=Morus notabilis TaxID=981085 RepID=UPI000CED07B8|nr:uncharacterized protein LOC21389020 isoform X2 [Morus notabilis]